MLSSESSFAGAKGSSLNTLSQQNKIMKCLLTKPEDSEAMITRKTKNLTSTSDSVVSCISKYIHKWLSIPYIECVCSGAPG